MAKLQFLLAGLYATSALASPWARIKRGGGWGDNGGPGGYGQSTTTTEGGAWGYGTTTTCKASTITKTQKASTVYETQKASTVSKSRHSIRLRPHISADLANSSSWHDHLSHQASIDNHAPWRADYHHPARQCHHLLLDGHGARPGIHHHPPWCKLPDSWPALSRAPLEPLADVLPSLLADNHHRYSDLLRHPACRYFNTHTPRPDLHVPRHIAMQRHAHRPRHPMRHDRHGPGQHLYFGPDNHAARRWLDCYPSGQCLHFGCDTTWQRLNCDTPW